MEDEMTQISIENRLGILQAFAICFTASCNDRMHIGISTKVSFNSVNK